MLHLLCMFRVRLVGLCLGVMERNGNSSLLILEGFLLIITVAHQCNEFFIMLVT